MCMQEFLISAIVLQGQQLRSSYSYIPLFFNLFQYVQP